jgi:16S rRNA (guanine966-N2)-methyltransferase
MRIVGGRYRGRKLAVPKSAPVRPTADRVKEALFSILANRVTDARVLDLFAGSGALGIEAASRGAERVVLVDRDPRSIAAIERNTQFLGPETQAVVLRLEAPRLAPRLKELGPFDLIFMDPPYGTDLASRTLETLSRENLAAPEALAVVETDRSETLAQAEGWRLVQRRDYGRTSLWFLEPDAEDSGSDESG